VPSTRPCTLCRLAVDQSTDWEFLMRIEKICATANAVSLGQAERNAPDEGRGKNPIPASTISGRERTTKAHLGDALVRKPLNQ